MKITVAICTWNRAPVLRRVLESISNASPPRQSAWEILIINNNCTDATDDVAGEFRVRLPIFLHHEKNPGLSNARNKAIEVSSGDYIVWIDDDVTVRRDWIAEFERAFLQWREVSVFGGSIFPALEGDPPLWLRSLRWFFPSSFVIYGKRNFPEGPIDLASGKLPFGGNFAVRAEEQRKFRYDRSLGRRPGTLLFAYEETDVIRAILTTGGKGRWVPAAAVDHWIPRSRQTLSYLRIFYLGLWWTGFKSALIARRRIKI